MCLDGFIGVRADAQDLCTSALRGPADKINHRLSHRSLRPMLNLTEKDSSIEPEEATRGLLHTSALLGIYGDLGPFQTVASP